MTQFNDTTQGDPKKMTNTFRRLHDRMTEKYIK